MRLNEKIKMIAAMAFLSAIISCSNNGNSQKLAEASPPNNPPQATAPAAKLAKIVFVTTTQGCKCTLARCNGAETALKTALTKYENPPPVEFADYSKEPERCSEMARKHQVAMLPFLLFLDEKGGLIYMFQGNIDESQIQIILDKYLAKKKP